MSAMEVSIKWKERSGAPSANGTSNRENTSAAFFGPMKFRSLRKYQITRVNNTVQNTCCFKSQWFPRVPRQPSDRDAKQNARELFSQSGRMPGPHKSTPRVRMIFLAPIN